MTTGRRKCGTVVVVVVVAAAAVVVVVVVVDAGPCDIFKAEYLTLRRLMSYIYMEHPFLMFLDHTQRRSTVGRTPLDE